MDIRDLNELSERLRRNTETLFMYTENPESIEMLQKHDRCIAARVLLRAIQYDLKDTIELMFKYKADVDALELAIARGDIKTVKLNLSEGRLNWSIWNFERLAKCIVLRKDTRIELFKLLLEHGLDPRAKSPGGDNIFNEFIYDCGSEESDDIDFAETLVNSGVPIDEANDLNWTPLYISVFKNKSIKLIEYLIKKGANVNQRDCRGRSVLYQAAVSYYDDIFKLLVSNGADVNAIDCDGNTPLHMACLNHNDKIIDLSLRKGALVSAKNMKGKTPFSQLQIGEANYDACVLAMVRKFSKLTHADISVCDDDLRLLRKNPRAQNYFEKCTIEIRQMENLKFYANYSYSSVLSMSKNIKKLAGLVKNKKFVSKFEEHLHKFRFYEKELRAIFKEAEDVKNRSLIVETRLKALFKSFLPDVVIRILAQDLTVEDLPLD